MRRVLGFLMVGLLFAGTAAACSSDDDGGDDTTETTAADSGDSGDSGDAGGDVEAFCSDAADLGEQLQAAIDDPTSADAASITEDASALSASAAELTSANPDDVDRINECAAYLQVTP